MFCVVTKKRIIWCIPAGAKGWIVGRWPTGMLSVRFETDDRRWAIRPNDLEPHFSTKCNTCNLRFRCFTEV